MTDPNHETPPPSTTSVTAAEVEIQHLHSRVHDLEQAVAGFLSHEQHQHPKVVSWLEKVRNRATGLWDGIIPHPAPTSAPQSSPDATTDTSTSKKSDNGQGSNSENSGESPPSVT